MSVSKTPYEIRLEILQMAKDYMDKMQHIQIEFAKDAFHHAMTLGQMTAAQIKERIESFPKQYSIDELTKKANEMYAFVTKRD